MEEEKVNYQELKKEHKIYTENITEKWGPQAALWKYWKKKKPKAKTSNQTKNRKTKQTQPKPTKPPTSPYASNHFFCTRI